MEMKNVAGDTYIFPGATTIGLYLDGDQGTLIDTGIDENIVRKIYNFLNEKGIKIENVINTHSHADHIGGNSFLEKKGGIKFYSSNVESFFIMHTEFLPGYMFGSSPPNFLKNKFLMAENTSYVNTEFPKNFRIIDLSGHSWGMIGVITKDDVLFCADAFYSEIIVKKHPLLFHINTKNFMDSMEKLLKYDYIKVIAHGGLVNNVEKTISTNMDAINNIIEFIFNNTPKFKEDIYSDLSTMIGLNSPWEYYLNIVPFNSILAYLEMQKKIKFSLKEGRIFIEKL